MVLGADRGRSDGDAELEDGSLDEIFGTFAALRRSWSVDGADTGLEGDAGGVVALQGLAVDGGAGVSGGALAD